MSSLAYTCAKNTCMLLLLLRTSIASTKHPTSATVVALSATAIAVPIQHSCLAARVAFPLSVLTRAYEALELSTTI